MAAYYAVYASIAVATALDAMLKALAVIDKMVDGTELPTTSTELFRFLTVTTCITTCAGMNITAEVA